MKIQRPEQTINLLRSFQLIGQRALYDARLSRNSSIAFFI